MRETIDYYNKLLEVSIDEDTPLGLAKGKMGICIYLYYLSKEKDTKKTADNLLNHIFEEIHSIQSLDIYEGLAGIGLGISFLIKNKYVTGDPNKILSDIDDEIFKQVSFSKLNDNTSTLIQFLFYFYVRKQDIKKNTEFDILSDELIIYIINILHSKIEQIVQEEELAFSLEYKLPQILFAFSLIYKLDICNYKIIKIINEISPFIVSKLPYSEANKLYLAWSIDKINKIINNDELSDFYSLLISQIDMNRLIDNEFENKNIFVRNGISGLLLLLMTFEDIPDNFRGSTVYSKIKNKIDHSSAWEFFDNKQYLKHYTGLIDFCGVLILSEKISKNI